ncbi:hypothetical protein HYU45_00205 [Candidatus Daviesbacteria bacterium]|nr:hypothetical protein [Candidatus Daviesbacteria bacterium]
MAAVEILKRGSVKAMRARSGCEGCPFAGSCAPCRPQTSGRVLVVESIKELLKKEKLPVGTIYFSGPARTGESEKTCSKCKEPASTCLHSETSKR